MRKVFFVFFLASAMGASGQRVIDVTKEDANAGNLIASVGGEPVVMARFTKLVSGTPYFKDEWLKGILLLQSGKQITGMSLKLDLYNNEVHYLNDKQQEYIATIPVKEVILEKAGVQHRFVPAAEINPAAKKGWYQALYQNNGVALYKSFGKVLNSNKPYGSATEEQSITNSEVYIVQQGTSLHEIKRFKDATSVLSSKKNELEAWLKKEDLKNTSADDRFIALVDYYSSLFPEQK